MIGVEKFKIASSQIAGQNVDTAQPWFPSNGAFRVAEGTLYFFTGLLWLVRAAGTVSHTTSLSFGGTATITSIRAVAQVKTGDATASATQNMTGINTAAGTVVKAASVSASENIIARVEGVVRINAAGTFIPQFQYSAAPGGAPTIQDNSFFTMSPVGTDTSPQG